MCKLPILHSPLIGRVVASSSSIPAYKESILLSDPIPIVTQIQRQPSITQISSGVLFNEEELVEVANSSPKNKTDVEIAPRRDALAGSCVYDVHGSREVPVGIPYNNALIRKTASILSPLRYPGSKRRFAGYVAEALRLNGTRPSLFVEPFAGGASVALQMLGDNLVENIGLGEKDPFVADFWQCVFFDTEWLIQSIEELEISLDTWHFFRQKTPKTPRENAITCLFLNRTNFSGILRDEVGPIGGVEQLSQYDIGCRFPKKTLIKRIRQASALRDRVQFVRCDDWVGTMKHALDTRHKQKQIFFYFDPPFYEKAADLYRFHFAESDHLNLRDALKRRTFRWMLSYDSADFIRELYSDRRSFPAQHGVELLYTIARSKLHNPVKEIVVTNLPQLPTQDRVWRTTAQW